MPKIQSSHERITLKELEVIQRESESALPRGELLTQEQCIKIIKIFHRLLDPALGVDVVTEESFSGAGSGKKQKEKWDNLKRCFDYDGNGEISIDEFFSFFITYGLRETKKSSRSFTLKDLMIDRYTKFREVVSRQISVVEEFMNE